MTSSQSRLTTYARVFRRPAAAASLLGCALGASWPAAAEAQQFAVDDADVVELRACQLEAWHGERASWILPACRPFGSVELTVGLGFVDASDGDDREAEYVTQAKLQLVEPAPGSVGVSLVAGAGMAPLPQLVPGEFSSVFAYVAGTLGLAEERVRIHPNLGWFWERDGDDRDVRHAFTWGIRTDLQLVERLAAIAELFGENTEDPAWQAGFRLTLVPERLEVDLSYGDHLDRDERGVGFQAGIAWTPPPLR